MPESSPNEKKTIWEKEKLLATSNFYFSHSVFKRLVLNTRENQGLFGKRLKLFAPNILNIVQFLDFSHLYNPTKINVFRGIMELACLYIHVSISLCVYKILVILCCKFLQFCCDSFETLSKHWSHTEVLKDVILKCQLPLV